MPTPSRPRGRSRIMPQRQRPLRLESLESRAMLASVTLTPTADSTLYEDSAGLLANGAGTEMVAGRSDTSFNIRRSILRFDVSSAIPANAQIDSVSLQLTQLDTSLLSQDMQLRSVLQPWSEGTLNAGSNFQDGIPENPLSPKGSVTWKFTTYRTSSWLNLGGLFQDQPVAEQSIGTAGAYSFSSNQMANDVRAWRDNPTSQYGWVLLASNEETTTGTKFFATREATDLSTRPQLTINYSVVTNHPPTVKSSLPNQQIFTEQPYSYTVPADTFEETDPNQSLNYSALRPDLSALPDWLSFDPVTRTFSGTPTATDSGRIQVQVTAFDTGVPPLSASTQFTLDILSATAPWHNSQNPSDVDGDGAVVPLDALLIINELNFPTFINPQSGALPPVPGTLSPPPFVDVDGDNFCVPIDALIVINTLNQGASGEAAEGEAAIPLAQPLASLTTPRLLSQLASGGAGQWLSTAGSNTTSSSGSSPVPAAEEWLDLLVADQSYLSRLKNRLVSRRV